MALNFMMHKYRILGKKGEGTFSEVLKCQNIKDGTYWACKKMKQSYESMEQVNSLREVQALRRLSPHANILELYEVLFDKKSGTLLLICELMDMNIYEMIKERETYLGEYQVKLYMYCLCKSVAHMHRNGIFHRDVKPENILVKDEKLLKLADFGSCRSVYSKQPYTEYISTRWYRAPECLLTDGYYTYKMDIWSVGCVFFEIMSLRPLFPGANEVDQIAKIHDVLGTPDPSVLNKLKNKARGINFNFPQKKGTGLEKLIPHASSECTDLIYQMCTYDPDERISAKQALRHPYFRELREEDKRKLILTKAQKETQSPKESHVTSGQNDDRTQTITYPPLNTEKPNSQREDEESAPPGESTIKQSDKRTDANLSDQKDSKSEKEQKNIEEKSKTNELEPTDGDTKRRRTPPGVKSGKTSPGSTHTVKYPASIIHNSYQYQRRERERKRVSQTVTNMARLLKKRQRQIPGRIMGESTGSSPVSSFFPKVTTMPKPSSYHSTFRNNPYASGQTSSSLPKIGTTTSGPGKSTYLPTLTQAFVKSVKTKNVQATKNIYGNYQLPSIDKRGAGY